MDLLKINDPEGELPNSFYTHSIKKKTNYTSVKKDMICQICIIGAGYTGLSAGLSLAELGYEVVILEANRVGSEHQDEMVVKLVQDKDGIKKIRKTFWI